MFQYPFPLGNRMWQCWTLIECPTAALYSEMTPRDIKCKKCDKAHLIPSCNNECTWGSQSSGYPLYALNVGLSVLQIKLSVPSHPLNPVHSNTVLTELLLFLRWDNDIEMDIREMCGYGLDLCGSGYYNKPGFHKIWISCFQ